MSLSEDVASPFSVPQREQDSFHRTWLQREMASCSSVDSYSVSGDHPKCETCLIYSSRCACKGCEHPKCDAKSLPQDQYNVWPKSYKDGQCTWLKGYGHWHLQQSCKCASSVTSKSSRRTLSPFGKRLFPPGKGPFPSHHRHHQHIIQHPQQQVQPRRNNPRGHHPQQQVQPWQQVQPPHRHRPSLHCRLLACLLALQG
jgi:hypothetical protein